MTAQLASTEKSARASLRGRVLVEIGATAPHASAISPHHGGLKITGSGGARHVRQLSRTETDFPVLFDAEPYCDYTADPQRPFLLHNDGLFTQSLEDRLQEQRTLGATAFLTPTGHLPVGTEALETAVQRSNRLSDSDTILSLPLHYGWFTSDATFDRLTAVLAQSNNLVSISIAHDQDPFTEPSVADRLRELVRLDCPPVIDRTDFAGLDYVVRGGTAATIGISSRLRHGLSPSIRGRRFRSSDNRMSVVWPGMLRFVRPVHLDDLFGRSRGPECDCPYCGGQPINAFSTSADSQQKARNHNAWWLGRLSQEVLSRQDTSTPLQRWKEIVLSAIEGHERLRVELRRPSLSIPPMLETWVL